MGSVKALLLVLLASAAPSGAAVFTVTKTADTYDRVCGDDCSLRDAVAEANRDPVPDVIELPPGIYTLSRSGAKEDQNATGDLDVLQPLLLVGAGAGRTVIDGNGSDRVLDVAGEMEIYGVTLRNGRADAGGGGLRLRNAGFGARVLIQRSVISGNHALGSGGGILGEVGTVVLAASTVVGNQADLDGGGLAGYGLAVVSSTVTGNRAGRFGGGLHSSFLESASVLGSTFVLNEAGAAGGGLYVDPAGPPVALAPFLGGSILAANRAPQYPDCFSAVSKGGNVIGVLDSPTDCQLLPSDARGTQETPLDLKLGPLSSSLGPTPVHAPLPGSPALGRVADAALCAIDDQRGQGRGGVPCDAGAVELNPPSCVPGGAALCLQEGRFRVTASWSAQSNQHGEAQPVPLSADSGDFWFFTPDNLELTVKVLDGCGVNGHWWVFTSGLTDLGIDLKVEDLVAGTTWTNTHAAGTAYPPRLDTSALAGCGVSGTPLVRAGGAAGSSVLVPTTEADTFDATCDHDCSLRDAVAAANAKSGLDVIVLGPGLYTLSRAGRGENSGATGDLDVHSPLAVLGAGADRTVIDGGRIDRVFHSFTLSPLELHNVTVRGGDARLTQFQGGDGGGIAAEDLTLVACHVTGNHAQNGGGGISASAAILRDSTVSDNQTDASGGGLYNGAVLRLDNVTISGNRAAQGGGGLLLFPFDILVHQTTITGNRALNGGGLATVFATCPSGRFVCRTDFGMSRSIVAGNTAAHDPDCLGLAGLVGDNLFGIIASGCTIDISSGHAGTPQAPLDPRLTPLGDHGVPTPTHALEADSPAVDLVPAEAACSGLDQRGRRRPADGDGDGAAGCDVGAVERQPTCQPGPSTLCLGDGDRFRVTATWAAQGGTGAAGAHPLALDTGSFWFFDPANLELTLKVLNGCGVNQRYWVFLTGLTDVGVDVTVEDTRTGKTWHHHHPGGTPLPTVTDTGALDICP